MDFDANLGQPLEVKLCDTGLGCSCEKLLRRISKEFDQCRFELVNSKRCCRQESRLSSLLLIENGNSAVLIM